MTRLANAMVNLFPVFVLGAALCALAQPAAFDWFDKAAITPALAVTMLGMGLTLTFNDFREVLATPGRIFAGFALQYTIMPLMAFAVSRLMGLPLAFTIGLCIVGSCPGGTASNVVTYLARADVTLSVAMTTASTLGAVVATPMLTQLLLGTLVPVDAKALLVSTLQVVLLPVLVGAAINTFFHKQVEVLAPFSALSAVVLIALICGSVVAQNAAAVVQAGPKLLAAIFLLHAGGFFFGYALSRAVGIPERAARTNSIEVGMQNSALGAVLASVHFPAHPLAAVPCAISACMHSVMGSLLAAVWRGQPTGEFASQDVEVEDPLAELAGAAAAVETAVEAAVGTAASTVAGTVAAAGATVLSAAARSGDTVPEFSAETTQGKMDSFHQFCGGKWTMLLSHPSDFTPVCTSELGSAAKLQGEFKKRGVQLVALSCNDLESHKQWVKDIEGSLGEGKKIEYPIIADADRSIAKKWGMMDPDEKDSEGKAFAARTVFIVGPEKDLKLALLYPSSTGRNFSEGEEVMISPKVSNEEADKITPVPDDSSPASAGGSETCGAKQAETCGAK
ncbi:putative sodium metabolite cotransporter chloroplastic [Chlorella sorokiniana]|uniref:Sodium metabolite cotransporter chloroplastic n=1 Tax=Chlorella sorokiniana TaxID=3076 RepID=A0A2P6U349_CHLSO|nr:putative sodium metabolite cotransporter chloroplastic [Chlorella sorokiniana]|eukprot:PRW60740.1 putative sodium metabolite cotransporter chloroplastic [Chlorella sorokiniana]